MPVTPAEIVLTCSPSGRAVRPLLYLAGETLFFINIKFLQGVATELRRSIRQVQEAVSVVSDTRPWLSSRSWCGVDRLGQRGFRNQLSHSSRARSASVFAGSR